MVRSRIRDYRRSELIEATITALAERGLSEITLTAVAAQAGMSPALVSHYFDGKDELLEATLRNLARGIARLIHQRLPPNPTPLERMHAIIDGCFEAENFRPGAMLAWTSSWLHMQTNPRLARLQRTINRRYRSNMLFALREIAPRPLALDIATGLFAMIDGFWLREAIERGAIPAGDARRLCRAYLALMLRPSTEEASPPKPRRPHGNGDRRRRVGAK